MPSGFLVSGAIGPVAMAKSGGAADWWSVPGQTCVAAYKAIGATDLAASYVNLANPGTNNAAPGGAPGLAAGGWTLDGIDDYLDSGIIIGIGWSWIVRFSNRTSGIALLGSLTAPGPIYHVIYPNDSNTVLYGAGGIQYPAGGINAGVLAVAGQQGYKNGEAHGSAIGAAASSQRPMYLGCANLYGTPNYFTAVTIAAVSIYSDTLSAAEVAEKSAAMAALA